MGKHITIGYSTAVAGAVWTGATFTLGALCCTAGEEDGWAWWLGLAIVLASVASVLTVRCIIHKACEKVLDDLALTLELAKMDRAHELRSVPTQRARMDA